MPFLNVGSNSNDLTLQVPTRGTTDWATEFLQNFAQPLSTHDHTGGGRGAQLGGGAFADNSINGQKILFNNDEAHQWRDSGGTETDILKYDSSDLLRILVPLLHVDELKNETTYSLSNNQAAEAQVGSIDFSNEESATVHFHIKREGTADLSESGTLEISKIGGSYYYNKSRQGDRSGVNLTVDSATGELRYTSTDNPGSTSESLYLNIIRRGDK